MTVSLTGDGIYLIAIAWQVLKISDNPSALALVGLCWSLPMALLILFSGVLSDRVPRRRLMLAGDLVRGIAIATMGVVTLRGTPPLWPYLALAAVYGCGQALFGPANAAIVPDLVPADELVQANALGEFVRPFAATLLGPAIGGVIVGTVGPGWAFVADAATFAFSAVMILSMQRQPPATAGREPTSAYRDLLEGLRFVRSTTWLWVAMVAAAVSLLCFWGPFEVLVPFLVKNELHGSAFQLGLVFACGGAGAVLAALTLGQRKLPRRPLSVMYLSWFVATLMLAGFGLSHSLWPMYLVSAASNAGITILLIIWLTVTQRLVPSSLLGRVTSLDWLVSTAGVPASFALTGPVAAYLGVRPTLIVAGTVGAAVILAFAVLVPGARAPERDGSFAAYS
jgi:predicted MFS family arabinose efflux permease